MKHLGLMVILMCWAGFAYLLRKWPNGRAFSISRHAASDKRAYLMMALLETIYIPLFFVFLLTWFVPELKISAWFLVFSGLSLAGFLVAAWVPDTHGWKNRVHEICSYGGAILMVPAGVVLSASDSLSSLARSVSVIATVYMVTVVLLLGLTKKVHDHHLPLQLAYFLVFHISVLCAVYLG